MSEHNRERPAGHDDDHAESDADGELRPLATPDDGALDADDDSVNSERGGASLTALLRGALKDAPEDDPLPSERAILRGVQDRLRERSGGRFYGLGWGSAPEAPIATYLVSSLFIIAVVGALYVTLRPATASATVLPPIELRLVPQR